MKKLFAWIDRLIEYFVAFIFTAIVMVGLLQVFNRFVLNASLSWTEEFQVFGHIWLIFLAIPIAYQRGAHMNVEMVVRTLPRPVRGVFNLFVELLWAAFAISVALLAYKVSQVAAFQESPGLEISMSYPYYGMVIGNIYLLFVVVRRLAKWRLGLRSEQLAP